MPVAAAPFGSQVQLRCSVIEEYGIFWRIVLTSDPDVALDTESNREITLLRSNGIEVAPSSSLTTSMLVVNETEGSNGANITCIAFEEGVVSQCRSGTSRVIFHGEYCHTHDRYMSPAHLCFMQVPPRFQSICQSWRMGLDISMCPGPILASYPGPSARAREKKEGPGIHCLRMRQLH